ncbi:J domain-containing protein [Candidatus Dependentiae bacterium]|nr:J domain-containing protein [Candidatus Dependentiae bacterium]
MYIKTSLHFSAYLLLIFSISTTTLLANGKGTGCGVNIGNASFVIHDYGIKITRNTDTSTPYNLYKNPNIFSNKTSDNLLLTGLAAAVIRAALVPLESRLLNDHSARGNVKKAFISLVRCIEEVCYVLNHPNDEHIMDLTWAIVDAAQTCKHLAAACKALPVTENEEAATVAIKSSGITPRQVSALLEGICATLSMITPSNSSVDVDTKYINKVNFGARSAISFLRLLRNFNDIPYGEENNKQRNIYAALMALQAFYSSIKFGLAHFEPTEANRNPHYTSFGDTTGWHFNSKCWKHDPYERFKQAHPEPVDGYSQADFETYFGSYACLFLPDTPEYDFWYNQVRKVRPSRNPFNGSFRGFGFDFDHPERPAAWKPGMMIPTDVVEQEPSRARRYALQNLGVSSNATDREIRVAYLKLSKEHHPDKGGDPEKFKVLNQANKILTDTP